VIGLLVSHPSLTLGLLVPAVAAVVLLIYLTVKYAPIIRQKFEEPPLFLPLRVGPSERGEPVAFPTADGFMLAGTYLRARTAGRAGVMVYCHEFLSNRWSYRPYIDHLRDLGFDVFTFDFRNHGESPAEPGYEPMHWASDREVTDLRAALAYLRSRPDRDPAGYGLFGVSRGGTTALLVTPEERDVWGVITDGAFPTIGTMMAYILRWAELYLRNPMVRNAIPRWLYRSLARSGRRRSERGRGCRFPDLERAVARMAPRPWLAIHGQRDTYINPEIVEELFDRGNGPREMWLVPDAKHNRCREREPEAYAGRLLDFVDRYAPRRPITESPESESESESEAESQPEPVAKPTIGVTAAGVELAGGFDGEIEAPERSTGEVAAPIG
jgi:alpha-beta hydrolase superfamily lysophospholipase